MKVLGEVKKVEHGSRGRDRAFMLAEFGQSVDPEWIETNVNNYIQDLRGRPGEGELIESFLISPDRIETLTNGHITTRRVAWWLGWQVPSGAVRAGQAVEFEVT